jgi:hypothetical protein
MKKQLRPLTCAFRVSIAHAFSQDIHYNATLTSKRDLLDKQQPSITSTAVVDLDTGGLLAT